MKLYNHRLSALLLTGTILFTSAHAAGTGMDAFAPTTPYTAHADLAPNAWYLSDVRTAFELGLMTGKGGDRFDPLGTLTMAEAITLTARIHSAYHGGGFTPGGEPWFQNAVSYCVQQGILLRNEFEQFTVPATRAQLAGLFAYALADSEYSRLARVPSISDVNWDTPYVDEIYLLYGAGILTGDSTGAFHPNATATRAETAAMVNRLVLPEGRKAPKLTVPEDRIVSAEGDMALLPPKDWSPTLSAGSINLSAPTGNSSLSVLRQTCGNESLEELAADYLSSLRDQLGGVELLIQPQTRYFRGLPSCYTRLRTIEGAKSRIMELYVLPGSQCFYTMTLSYVENSAVQAEQTALQAAAYSLDLGNFSPSSSPAVEKS